MRKGLLSVIAILSMALTIFTSFSTVDTKKTFCEGLKHLMENHKRDDIKNLRGDKLEVDRWKSTVQLEGTNSTIVYNDFDDEYYYKCDYKTTTGSYEELKSMLENCLGKKFNNNSDGDDMLYLPKHTIKLNAVNIGGIKGVYFAMWWND